MLAHPRRHSLYLLLCASMSFAHLALGQPTDSLIATITVPGRPLEAFDIGWVDAATQRYYFSDRSNKSVDIIDARTNAFIGRVDGFAGATASTKTAGPNGVLVLSRLKQVWASNGDSTVKVIDVSASPAQIVATINTGGGKRANEMAYAEELSMVMVTNEAETPPYVTLISTKRGHPILGQIKLAQATDGLEQPVWDRVGRHFYLSIPELDHDKAKGAVAQIDPNTMKVVREIPVDKCMPAGLAFGPDQHLLVGCSQDAVEAGFPAKSLIVDVRTGAIVQTITEVGGSDEVWYNPGDNRYYLAARGMPGGAVLGVIDAKSNMWVANIPTAKNAHSVAANPGNNHIFVPLTPGPTCPTGCVAVYASERIQRAK
jgi:hypothetical protein